MFAFYDLAGADPAHRFSPYCWRVRLAMAHKGLEPATIAWRFHQKAELPKGCRGTVPVLVDGAQVIDGSTEVAFYLEERFATGPSLFGGPGGEAHARFIIAWSDRVLLPALSPVIAPSVLAHLHPADCAYFRKSREERFGMTIEEAYRLRETRLPALKAALAPLREVLQHQPFLGGEEPSYADYAAFSGFQWARCVSALDVLAGETVIRPWVDRVLDLFEGLARGAVCRSA